MKSTGISLALFLLLSLAPSASGREPPAITVDPESRVGTSLPPIELTDDSGRRRSLKAYSGQPLILLPMYTNCQKTCLGNVQELRRALDQLALAADQYRVLLFSFDRKETPSSLQRFREKHGIPLSWSLATSDETGIRVLMGAIAFQFADENGQFMHPNRVAFLTPDLKIARFVYGSRFPTFEIREGLRLATDPAAHDVIHAAMKYLLGVLMFVVTLLAVILTSLLQRRRQNLTGSRPST